MIRTPALVIVASLLAPTLSAQATAGKGTVPTVEQQIAAAVLPLPKDLRDGATVMGYRSGKNLETIRPGKNGMICLALFPVEENFHVACYPNGMEPFMARGRELRAQGVKDPKVDSVRFAEVKSGKLAMPRLAVMYQIFGKPTSWDAATGKVTDVSTLLVVYVPGATSESTGLSPVPAKTGPWIMFPGTPKAHIMLSGTMSP